MAKKTIYLIRHGETEYNRLGIVQGSGVDATLNDIGIAQATAFYQTYQYIPFDKIYTSTLQRTVQTVQSFLDLGIPHQALDGFDEISWGEKEGKVPNYHEDGAYMTLIDEWQKGNTSLVSAKGGESPEEVAARQRQAIKIVLENEDEDLILISMHGRAMRILLTQLTRQPLSNMDEFEHSNVCLYKLIYDTVSGEVEIVTANDTSHLMLVHS